MSSVFEANETDPSWLLIGKAIFGIGLALAAPFVAYALVQTILTASRSKSWPETQATIAASEVATDFPVGARGPQFEPKVEYRYAVQGKPHVGHEIALRKLATGSKDDAERVAAKYAVGSQHRCITNPANPSKSLLERGTSSLTYIGLGIPVVMILVGPMMAREQTRVLRRRSATARRTQD